MLTDTQKYAVNVALFNAFLDNDAASFARCARLLESDIAEHDRAERIAAAVKEHDYEGAQEIDEERQ